jgi:uncharacterized Tic20 family protein
MKGTHMSFEEERVKTSDDLDDAPPRQRAIEVPSSGELTAEEKQWGMFCHLSALAGLVVGGLLFIGPLVCWLIKKDTSRFVDYHGKESLNFQINIFILSMILAVTVIGIFLIPIVVVVGVVMPIIAGLKANEGELYEYPYIYRIIK